MNMDYQYEYEYQEDKPQINWDLLWMVLGCLLGTLFVNLFLADSVVQNGEVYSLLAMMKGQSLPSGSELFVYLAGRRGMLLLLLLFLFYLFSRRVASFFTLLFLGFLFGVTLSMQVMISGIAGIFYWLLAALPQGIFYLLAVFYLAKNVRKKHRLFVAAVVMLLFFLGILCESYINLRLLQFFSL